MKDKCPECGKVIYRKTSNYWYKESGLDNVFLENIPVYECSCGISYPSIFRVPWLNDLIARTLLKKPALLNGKEIRFLRKNLFLPATAFSEALSVRKDTFSKWENDIQKHSEGNDRLIRATYTILKGISGKDAQKLFKYLAKIQLGKQHIKDLIIAAKLEDDYVVARRLITETETLSLVSPLPLQQEPSKAFAKYRTYVMSQSQMKSGLQVSSLEFLSAKTDPQGSIGGLIKWRRESRNWSMALSAMI